MNVPRCAHLDAAAASFALLAEEARTKEWPHVEFLARLVAEQATADRNRRLAARLRYARFPYRRRLEDFDFEFQPSVDRKLVEDLATLRFIEETPRIGVTGDEGAPAVAVVVVDLVDRPTGTIVHLDILPGRVEDYLALALARRTGAR